MNTGNEPIHPLNDQFGVILAEGLTKREYFAAMAMQAIRSHERFNEETTAEMAVDYADALLRALERKPE